MARSFGDLGASIFGWFFDGDDTNRIVEVSSKSGPSGFTISRTNKDDQSVATALTATTEYGANCINVTASDSESPSFEIRSDKFKDRNVTMSGVLCDPEMAVEIGYNDQKRYSLDLGINAEFASMTAPDINLCAAADSLLESKLMIGGAVNLPSSTKGQSAGFAVGAEYRLNADTVIAVRGNDNLKEIECGFMKERFRGNADNTLFGRMVAGSDGAEQRKMDFAVGMNHKVDEQSSVDVMVSNRDMVNVRYNLNNGAGLSGFMAAFVNLKDPRSRAKLQYGVLFEG